MTNKKFGVCIRFTIWIHEKFFVVFVCINLRQMLLQFYFLVQFPHVWTCYKYTVIAIKSLRDATDTQCSFKSHFWLWNTNANDNGIHLIDFLSTQLSFGCCYLCLYVLILWPYILFRWLNEIHCHHWRKMVSNGRPHTIARNGFILYILLGLNSNLCLGEFSTRKM